MRSRLGDDGLLEIRGHVSRRVRLHRSWWKEQYLKRLYFSQTYLNFHETFRSKQVPARKKPTPSRTPSRIPIQHLGVLRLLPFKSLRHLHRPPLQAFLHPAPIHAFVDCIPIRRRLLVLPDPVERHHRGIELAHQILPDVIDAMLVVALVHFRDVVLELLDGGEDGGVVVLPDVVEAVDGVGAHGGGGVGVAGGGDAGGILDGGGEVVADASDVGGGDGDLAVCRGCQDGKELGRMIGEEGLHFIMSCQASWTLGFGGPLKGDLYQREYSKRTSCQSWSMVSRRGAGSILA